MCLAVPGQIIEIREDDTGPMGGQVGTVDFPGGRSPALRRGLTQRNGW